MDTAIANQSDVLPKPAIAARFPRLIYLNGPAGSGKTSLCNHLKAIDPGITSYHFAEPLWLMANELRNAMDPFSEDLDFDTQQAKATRMDGPATSLWREYLVDEANVLRKHLGPDVLGRIALPTVASYLQEGGFDTVILPATRTKEDMFHLMGLVNPRDQVLIRIERSVSSWANDNGSYLVPDIPSITLSNDGTLLDFFSTAIAFLTGD